MIVTSTKLTPEKGTPEYEELDKWSSEGTRKYTVSKIMSQRMHYIRLNSNDKDTLAINFSEYKDDLYDILKQFTTVFQGNYSDLKENYNSFLFDRLEAFYNRTKNLLNQYLIEPKRRFDNHELKSLYINIPFNAYITNTGASLQAGKLFDEIFVKLIEYINEYKENDKYLFEASTEDILLDEIYHNISQQYDTFKHQISLSTYDSAKYNHREAEFARTEPMNDNLSKFIIWKSENRKEYLRRIAIYSELIKTKRRSSMFEIRLENGVYIVTENGNFRFQYTAKESVYDVVDKLKATIGNAGKDIDFSRPGKDWLKLLNFTSNNILNINTFDVSFNDVENYEKSYYLRNLLNVGNFEITSEIVAIVDKDVLTTLYNKKHNTAYNILWRSQTTNDYESLSNTSMFSSNYVCTIKNESSGPLNYVKSYMYCIYTDGEYTNNNDITKEFAYSTFAYERIYWYNSYEQSFSYNYYDMNLMNLKFSYSPDGQYVEYVNIPIPTRMIDKQFVNGYFMKKDSLSEKFTYVNKNNSTVQFKIDITNWNHIYGESKPESRPVIEFIETGNARNYAIKKDYKDREYVDYDATGAAPKNSIITRYYDIYDSSRHQTTLIFYINQDNIGKWDERANKYIREAHGIIKVYSYVGHPALLKYWEPEYNQEISYRYQGKFYNKQELHVTFNEETIKRVINDSEAYILTTIDLINIRSNDQ